MAAPVVDFVTGSVPNQDFQGRSTWVNWRVAVDKLLEATVECLSKVSEPFWQG
jgi:hypothetical protein